MSPLRPSFHQTPLLSNFLVCPFGTVNPTLADRSRGYFIFIRPPRLCFCFFIPQLLFFTFYCPVRAALTFVGCDKSKQKRAFVPIPFCERVRSGGEFFCYYLCLKLSFVKFCLIVIETTLCSTEKFTLLLVFPTGTAHEPL